MRGILLVCLVVLSIMVNIASLSNAVRLPLPSFSESAERMSNNGGSDVMTRPPQEHAGSLGEAYMNNEALMMINRGLARRLRGERRSLSTSQPPLSPEQAVLHPDYVCANTC